MKLRTVSAVLSLLLLLFCAVSAQGQAVADGVPLSEEAAAILAHYQEGAALPDDERVMALHEEMEFLLAKVEGKNDVSKVVILHDLLIQDTEMDSIAAGSGTPTTAYDALVGKRAADDGYAEALHLLYSAADVENVLVQARLLHDESPHRLNKVRIQGDWYNVDAFIDDREREGLQIVCHGYCLFSDGYASQMYVWEMERYPMAERENNWHQRKNLVATNQEEMEALVAQGLDKGATQISLWSPAYARTAFDFTFVRQNPKVKSSTAMTTYGWPRPEEDDIYPTEVVFTLQYN